MATPEDHALARRLADETGALLVRLRAAHRDGSLKDAGDAGAQAHLAARLGAAAPGDAVLSEEARDTADRLSADRVWIIDPVDGTREFGEPPREDWAVHVALWEREAGLTAAAVALPAVSLTLATDRPPSLLPAHDGPPRVVVSRTRPPWQAQVVADALGGELVAMGSAGAKAMAVVRGLAEAYVHDGGQHEWDSAAPVAVARAAGLHCSRLDGGALTYNRPDPYLPDLLICRPELAEPILAALRDAEAGRA